MGGRETVMVVVTVAIKQAVQQLMEAPQAGVITTEIHPIIEHVGREETLLIVMVDGPRRMDQCLSQPVWLGMLKCVEIKVVRVVNRVELVIPIWIPSQVF